MEADFGGLREQIAHFAVGAAVVEVIILGDVRGVQTHVGGGKIFT